VDGVPALYFIGSMFSWAPIVTWRVGLYRCCTTGGCRSILRARGTTFGAMMLCSLALPLTHNLPRSTALGLLHRPIFSSPSAAAGVSGREGAFCGAGSPFHRSRLSIGGHDLIRAGLLVPFISGCCAPDQHADLLGLQILISKARARHRYSANTHRLICRTKTS